MYIRSAGFLNFFLAIYIYSSVASNAQLGVTLLLGGQISEAAAGCPWSGASVPWGLSVGMRRVMLMVLMWTILRSSPKMKPEVLEEPTWNTGVSKPLWRVNSLSLEVLASQVEFWLCIEGIEEPVGGLERSFILGMAFCEGAILYFPVADFHGISSSLWFSF